MVGGGSKKVEVSSSSSTPDKLTAGENLPPTAVYQRNKEVKKQEKYPFHVYKENKGEEDGKKKGEGEEIDREGNKGDSHEEKEEEIGVQEEGNVGEEFGRETEGKEKLDEVFYEVEAIRKKRNHKGQLQYLIKWRYYPETDNTWEPYDNIKHCTDLLEAFEQSLQNSKHKKALHKKKHSMQIEDDGDSGEEAMTQKGGEENSPLSPFSSKGGGRSGGSERLLTIDGGVNVLRQNPKRNVISRYMKEKKILKDEKGKEKSTDDEVTANEIPEPLPKVQQGVEEMNKEGGKNFVMQDYVRKWREKEEAKGGVGAAAMAILLPNCKVDKAGHGKNPSMLLPTGAMPSFYSESEPQSSKEGTRLTGAQKRKSGCVRRFVHPNELAKKAMDAELVDSTEALAASTVAANTATGINSKMAKEEVYITKILKPVQLFATPPTAENIPNLCITFKALRSDGTKVLVNNRELRAINPLLLIDFYEQHLHYTPDP